MPDDDPCCVREWKRDGSRNRLKLKDACQTIRSNPLEEPRRLMSLTDVEDALRAGEVLQTPHSRIWMELPS